MRPGRSASASISAVLRSFLWAGLLLLGVPAAGASSSLVAQVDSIAERYHEDLARVDSLRQGLEDAVRTHAQEDTLVALARVSFIWGDVRAMTQEQKLETYDRGRQAAQRAVGLNPKNVAAHFWYATNAGRWAQARGVLQSLFLLSTLREEIQTVLDLAPTFTAVYSLAGYVALETPRFFGGDPDNAEAMFRKGLEQDPKFTGMRIGLAKTLIRKGQIPEATRELEAVLAERQPSNLADWTVKDTREARELLDLLRARS